MICGGLTDFPIVTSYITRKLFQMLNFRVTPNTQLKESHDPICNPGQKSTTRFFIYKKKVYKKVYTNPRKFKKVFIYNLDKF